MNSIQIWQRLGVAALLLCATFAGAQTYTKLYAFPEDTRNDTGIGLGGIMTQGRDGNLYGTIGDDNANAAGSAFKMTTAGTFTRIHAFCALAKCADGSQPWGGLSLGKDGNFYGTTQGGGTLAAGTAFKLTPAGVLTTIWNFDNAADGAVPWYPLIQALDGSFWGASNTQYAGDYGALFRLVPTATPPYTESVPVDFNFTNGNEPNLPVQGTDGNLYGTTVAGGTSNLGLIFKTTAAGKITILHTFIGYPNDGTNPIGALVQANDGNFYGVTYIGGAKNLGSVFKITPSGTYTLLHSFAGYPSDGTHPRSGLIVGSDGNLYGTTLQGGAKNDGAVYKITPAGVVTILYSFCSVTNCTDGFSPVQPLVQHTNGKFYGNTSGNSLGGSYFYSLATGLAPFVRLANWSGKVGSTVEILGQGFTGTTGVTFNGVAATTFTNTSDTYMTAVVPAGATTGTLKVTTFTSTMSSNRPFRVTPQITSFAPASGIVGATVTITGVSLKQASSVTIGGKAATFTVNSDTQLTATVPAGALTGQKIGIGTAGGSASSATNFTVVPSIASFTPTSGKVGTSVTITGHSFTGATAIKFGGVAATSLQVINDTQVDALVPAGAVTGTISVMTAGGTGTSAAKFTVTP